MNICIIGTGYVGLVTGACFADFGHCVTCIDNNLEKINFLNKGGLPIYEISLQEVVSRNMKEGRLSFTTDMKSPIEKSTVIFIAVGTPSTENGSVNLEYVFDVVENIATHINGYTVIVTKSTVPVGTGRKIYKVIKDLVAEGIEFDVVSNPEFLREGSAIEDLMHPDRVVIGADSDKAKEIMKDIYKPLSLSDTSIVVSNIETAELIKYASNSFLATKISFINEMGHLCERLGANVEDLAVGMGLDKRIGGKFLHVSPGYGGSCFPKDTRAILDIAKKVNFDLKVVRATLEVNNYQKEMMVDKIEKVMGDNVKGKTIGILGLAFKPNTDDIRESPSIFIIDELKKKGAKIQAFDPVAMTEAKKVIKDIEYKEDAYATADQADAIVLITEWNEFYVMDLEKIKMLLKSPIFIDLRNVYNHKVMSKLGFHYESLGRKCV